VCGTVRCGLGGVRLCCLWDSLGRVRGSEIVLCVREFGVGLAYECALCVREIGAG